MTKPLAITDDSAAEPMPPGDLSVANPWRTARSWTPWIVTVSALVLYPLVFSTPYAHNWGVLACLTAVMACGWNVLGGITGQISLGHAAFFGIGAYATAALNVVVGVNPWLGLALGAVIAVALSAIVGLPIFRLRGHYFAIATIAVGEIAYAAVLNWDAVGAARGLSVPVEPDSLVRLQFSGQQKWEYYYLAASLLVLVLIASAKILRSRLGYYLVAIREDQDAAAALGVPVTWCKQLAFAFSAAVVAIAGGFYAQYVLFVDPDSTLALTISITITIAAVLGGVRSLWGPVIGAVTLSGLTEFTRLTFGGGGDALNLVVYGLLVMLIAAFEPNGLMGISARVQRVARRATS